MDLEFHLNSRQLSALFDEPDDDDATPAMFEDPEEIERMIQEEFGDSKRKRRRRIT